MIQQLELKPLCSLILQKTINDPDKHQGGLTKIFFRAGMLAALESLRSERLNALATMVQKNMRRRMAVKKFQELRSNTIRLQTWWRSVMAKRLVEAMRRDFAAKLLQTHIRRFIQRSNFVRIRESVIMFQSRECHPPVLCCDHDLLHKVFVVRKPDACIRNPGPCMRHFSYNLCFVECMCEVRICSVH